MSTVEPSARPHGRKSASPSIEDVARLAEVSAQTVSRVSTGADTVRAQTRRRVLAAMDQLGYVPNHAARALRSGSFQTIGVITQQLERAGEALTVAGVSTALEKEGYSLNLVQVHRPATDDLHDASLQLSNQAIDGLIIVRAGHATQESLSLPPPLPVAVSDSRLVGSYASVIPDQVSGTEVAVNHLLTLGHRQIHHIAGPAGFHPSLLRRSTWERELRGAGLTPPPSWEGDWSAASGYQLGTQLLRDPYATAAFCANDEMAFGLIRAIHEHGLEVPRDFSVVGFDGISLSEFSIPPLTTVYQDFRLIGEELTRVVLQQVRSRGPQEREHVIIPTELIIRGTTAPPGHPRT